MIRSVGAGGTNLNGLPQRKQQPETPFPKISSNGHDLEEQAVASKEKIKMVGVKPQQHMQSILDATEGIVRLNADGDRLEVSKRAISLANEYF